MAKQVDSTNIGGLLEALFTKIKSAFWRKSETSQLPIDNAPTSGSDNLVKSGGVYSAIAEKYTKPSGGIPASDLANGVIPDVSQFITKSVNDLVNYYKKTETYTQAEVNNLIGAIQQFHYEIAASTSAVTDPSNNVLYLIGPTGTGADKYEEYVYANNTWTKIGDTSIDLSDYVTNQALNTALASYTTSSDLTTLLAGKQDKIDANNKLDYSLIANTPTIPTEVFIVTYGTTTQAQIKAAVTAGQLPICKYGDNLYVYAGESSADYSQFTSVLYDTASRIYVKNSTWGNGEFDIYSKPSGGIPNSDLEGKFAGSPSAGGAAFKAMGIPFGEVDSTSTATEITATVDNFPDTLTDGVCAYIRNDVIASASGWTLDINGTGAKPVYQSLADASRVTTLFSAASTHLFIYNSSRVEGGCWDLFYGYNSNDNTLAYNVRYNSASKTAIDQFARYRILFSSADDAHWVPANTSTSTNATASRTVNQTPINPFGQIVYYGSTTSISAGGTPGATVLYTQYALTFGYSFNRTGAALTLTTKTPVYIKCAPQSNGSAIIDADTPYVQALPSTEDGKIYIYLGIASSATAVEMSIVHPVYYYKDGLVRPWINAADSNSHHTYTVSDFSSIPDSILEVLEVGDNVLLDLSILGSDDTVILGTVITCSDGYIGIYSIDSVNTGHSLYGYTYDSTEETWSCTYHTFYLDSFGNKIINGTDGHFVGLDSDEYIDSGYGPSSFATSAQGTKADNAVQYVSQTLTDAQKTQARSNIGAGTYTKPSTGIPASDIASGVIPEIITFIYDPNDEPDGADIIAAIEQGNIVYIEYDNAVYPLVYFVVYGSSYEASFGTAIAPNIYYLGFTYSEYDGTNWTYTYRNVPALSTNITTDKTSDFKAATPKAVYDEVHPAVQSTQPQGGFLPNVEYNLGTLTGNVTFALASAVTGIPNKWYWCFTAGSTAPTITWPTGLLWPQPDAEPPTIEANDEVEVEVKNGHIVALVFKPTS